MKENQIEIENTADAKPLAVKDLSNYELNKELSLRLPEAQARFFHVILLDEINDKYLLGMTNTQDIYAIDELSRVLDRPFETALISETDLNRLLDMIYRRTDEIYGFAEVLDSELEGVKVGEAEINHETQTAVLKLINSLFEDAIQVGATDIHIEPDENMLRVRFRVDGFLQEQIIQGKNVASAITQSLKLMANLNIAEKRIPQDGRFNINIRNIPVEVRLSTLPVQYGESIAARLLNQGVDVLNLGKIGMPEEVLINFRKSINLPKGIILVTGPTGSGKTTTLYAALNEINDISKKIITIEDPVEYRLMRLNQVQVNPQLDLTFARVLRAALRQDPDVILVGEIRDQETASIALRAALTGHLVLATLHTNDAASTAIRLIDMGIEGYLVAATLNTALAQRLIRCICSNCKTEYQPTEEERAIFQQGYGIDLAKEKFFKGEGCQYCNSSGYQGRTGIYELLEFNEDMREALRQNNTNDFIQITSQNTLNSSLLASGYDLARQGVTSLTEVLRVAGG